MAGIGVKINEVTKKFGRVTAVDNLSLDIKPGELFTLLGPSGCGKTTLLRTIAGFYFQNNGSIFFDKHRIDTLPPHKRDTGMVFQSYAVFPFMNVFDNVAYGLKARRVPKKEINERVSNAIELVRLTGMEKRRPDQLSGGQQQRVAVARAVVIEPRVLLMDEPLSNLDAKLRVDMRVDIKRLQRKLGTTMIYVTHDQEEALAISDRIAVMSKGKIAQIGSPWEIYHNPVNKYVADFIGITNFFRCKIVSFTENKTTILFLGKNIELSLSVNKDIKNTNEVIASIRPEALTIVSKEAQTTSSPDRFSFTCTVVDTTYLGSSLLIIAETKDGTQVKVSVNNPDKENIIEEASRIQLEFSITDLSIFPAGIENDR
ncbi:MAG: ABC transporter ATP-binding protein [Spirochaetales bacterium]|nr:ABC transporter ATP-binding protein [Spirochaetales bacterium]